MKGQTGRGVWVHAGWRNAKVPGGNRAKKLRERDMRVIVFGALHSRPAQERETNYTIRFTIIKDDRLHFDVKDFNIECSAPDLENIPGITV